MHLLGIDLGTSGTKATIVDTTGCIVCSATREHPLHTPRPGWSEQDPEDWLRQTLEGLKDLLASEQADKKKIRGIGVGGLAKVLRCTAAVARQVAHEAAPEAHPAERGVELERDELTDDRGRVVRREQRERRDGELERREQREQLGRRRQAAAG